jgi:hypothetical protein
MADKIRHPISVNLDDDQLDYVIRHFLDNLISVEKIQYSTETLAPISHADAPYIVENPNYGIKTTPTDSALAGKKIRNISFPVITNQKELAAQTFSKEYATSKPKVKKKPRKRDKSGKFI